MKNIVGNLFQDDPKVIKIEGLFYEKYGLNRDNSCSVFQGYDKFQFRPNDINSTNLYVNKAIFYGECPDQILAHISWNFRCL